MMEEAIPVDWVEKISREETPAGTVIYREFFDRHGNLKRRDVEQLISVILTASGATKQE